MSEPDIIDPEFGAAMRKAIVAADTANRVNSLETLLRRWLELDGDNDDVAALIRDTREALHV
jgi:hypothetical protein